MSPTSIQIEERLGGWSGMLRHPLRTLWNLRQRVTAAQEEADALRAKLVEANKHLRPLIEVTTEMAALLRKDAQEIAALRAMLAMADSFHVGRDIRAQRRDDAWIVTDGCWCVCTDGSRETEQIPTRTDEAFIARTRFSREEAFRRARDLLASQEAPHG